MSDRRVRPKGRIPQSLGLKFRRWLFYNMPVLKINLRVGRTRVQLATLPVRVAPAGVEDMPDEEQDDFWAT